jgi:hypothetical protein
LGSRVSEEVIPSALSSPPPEGTSWGTTDLEAVVLDLLQDLPPSPLPPPTPGCPPVFSNFALWAALLVSLTRRYSSQRKVWQLLTLEGLWCAPPAALTVQAFYQRLARLPASFFQEFFTQLTALLRVRFAAVNDLPYARFASEILALDHTDLDPVFQKLQRLPAPAAAPGQPPKKHGKGNKGAIPGRLAAWFDLRRQQWHYLAFQADALRDVRIGTEDLLQHVPQKALLLFDLGYFGFPWFDQLTQRQLYWVTRLREKVSYSVQHVLYVSPGFPAELAQGRPQGGRPTSPQVYLRDSWVYLGRHRADRASQPVRLLELVFPDRVFRYLTNVLDPRDLPAAQVVELYRRRWGIERAFNFLKTDLQLFLIWSKHEAVILQQVFALLSLSQVVFALRTEVALAAQASLREVSLPDLLTWLPALAARGKDPIRELARRGRAAGVIRPYRSAPYQLLAPAPEDYEIPTEHPPPRKPRQSQTDRSTRSSPPPPRTTVRKRTAGWGQRSRRSRSR